MDAVELETFVGLEASVNDPFLVRRGARLGGAVRPLPWLGVAGEAAAYPKLGGLDYTPTMRILVDHDLAPDLSPIDAQGTLLAEVTPIRTRSSPIASALRLGAGAAVVHTVDDLELLGGRSDPPRDVRELHVGFAWSAAVDALRGPVGVRFRYAQTRYVESVAARHEKRNVVWLGADLVVTTP